MVMIGMPVIRLSQYTGNYDDCVYMAIVVILGSVQLGLPDVYDRPKAGAGPPLRLIGRL